MLHFACLPKELSFCRQVQHDNSFVWVDEAGKISIIEIFPASYNNCILSVIPNEMRNLYSIDKQV